MITSSMIKPTLFVRWGSSLARMGRRDSIHIKKLKFNAIAGPDLWNQLNPQRCEVSLNIGTDFSRTSDTDDLTNSLNYLTISRDILEFVKTRENWVSLGALTGGIFRHVKERYNAKVKDLEVTVQNRDTNVRTEHVLYTVVDGGDHDKLLIKDIELYTKIGVFPFERSQKQKVLLDIEIDLPKCGASKPVPLGKILSNVVDYVESSSLRTVEALAQSASKMVYQAIDSVIDDYGVTVKVIKHNAITNTDGVGASCSNDSKALALMKPSMQLETIVVPTQEPHGNLATLPDKCSIPPGWHTAYIAFGSNVGDRLQFIETALKLLEENPLVKLTNVSSIFQSTPMYVKDQDKFLNGCIEIKTQLSPHELLKLCKEIEYDKLKRVKMYDNGPRCIDLDICMYVLDNGEHIQINEPDLVVPHPRLLERSFVLEPLCELIPPNFTHPVTAEPLIDHLNQIYERSNPDDILTKLIPLPFIGGYDGNRSLSFKSVNRQSDFSNKPQRVTVSPTLIMGILNTTPDSFSDGGQFFANIEGQLNHVRQMCKEALGLHDQVIVDVGGCSTRPNSTQATVEEELERTIATIRAIRSCRDLPQDKLIISIDTYRAAVAREAIAAGADIINDISGGTFDDELFSVVAENPRVGYVLSHIRGNISTMNKLTDYSSPETLKGIPPGKDYIYDRPFENLKNKESLGITKVIGRELSQRYLRALERGVKRWQLILDPGLGFAKGTQENLQVIRQLPYLKNYSFYDDRSDKYISFRNIPLLIGPSRKAFIGHVTKEPISSNRDFATGSLVSSCIGFGADIVRVHNVKECSKSVEMADALYKESG